MSGFICHAAYYYLFIGLARGLHSLIPSFDDGQNLGISHLKNRLMKSGHNKSSILFIINIILTFINSVLNYSDIALNPLSPLETIKINYKNTIVCWA